MVEQWRNVGRIQGENHHYEELIISPNSHITLFNYGTNYISVSYNQSVDYEVPMAGIIKCVRFFDLDYSYQKLSEYKGRREMIRFWSNGNWTEWIDKGGE